MSDVVVFRAGPRHTLDDLARIARPPLEAAGALRAVVFGSYARGSADAYSDLDLVVVMQTDAPRLDRHRALRSLLDAIPIPVDLLVFTPEEYALGMRRWLGVFDSIAREGIVIHEARPS
jgi:predicted nucleotidyltransferase